LGIEKYAGEVVRKIGEEKKSRTRRRTRRIGMTMILCNILFYC
jgi:hypothetical protein